MALRPHVLSYSFQLKHSPHVYIMKVLTKEEDAHYRYGEIYIQQSLTIVNQY